MKGKILFFLRERCASEVEKLGVSSKDSSFPSKMKVSSGKIENFERNGENSTKNSIFRLFSTQFHNAVDSYVSLSDKTLIRFKSYQ